jgi:hypothetical protein
MTPRFVTQEQLSLLLDAWRLTAVGYPVADDGAVAPSVDPFCRYGRLMRAIKIAERQVGYPLRGAYKDLDDALGEHCGRITA